jgi:hypothetical protein
MNKDMKRLNVDELIMTSPSGRRHRDGRVRFFARMEEIRVGITLGYSLILLYEQYADVFKFSYSQFSRYVSKYIKHPTPEARQETADALKEQRDTEKGRPDSAESRATGMPQFNYRKDTPKDDLV